VNRCIAVLGPTASGKSALGLALAERLGGEIVNCDSTAVYRGFDIGTDKLSAAEQRGIPHHLIDIVDPTAEYSAMRRRPFAACSRAGGCRFSSAAPGSTSAR
jgi:tRNA dimethylallyltransferase